MKKKKQSPWSDPGLKEIWDKARKQEIWLQIVDGKSGCCMVAAGSLQELKRLDPKLERWVLRKIRKNELGLGNCIGLGAMPGTGRTLETACLNAIKALKRVLKNRSR